MSKILALLLLFPTAAIAQEQEKISLTCTPQTFHVLPGEPIQVELTVRTDAALPVRFHFPANPLLVLRAKEKQPIERTAQGDVIHRRVVIWQAVEPGTVKMNNISVEIQGRKLLFPEITITVSDPSQQ